MCVVPFGGTFASSGLLLRALLLPGGMLRFPGGAMTVIKRSNDIWLWVKMNSRRRGGAGAGAAAAEAAASYRAPPL